MPTRISNALSVTSSAGWKSSLAFGNSRRRLSIAVNTSCLRPIECSASWWICAFVVPPSAFWTWSTARGTAIQSSTPTRAAKAA
jgi:hypothetical protein